MRAVITGGTKGIGRAISLALCSPGSDVLVNYFHDETASVELVTAGSKRGARIQAFRSDACSFAGISALAAYAKDTLGGVDFLAHCAVVPSRGSALGASPDSIRDSIEQNGLSFLWLARAFAELLTTGSSVFYLTSAGATRAIDQYAPVGLAKAVGEAAMRYVAAELAPMHISVNALSPAVVDTEAFRAVFEDADRLIQWTARRSPIGRATTPDDVANVALMLATQKGELVIGQVLLVDGGLHLRQ